MLSCDHLTLRLVRLKSGEEWSQKRPGLQFLFPTGGGGKCLSAKSNRPFSPGDVLLISGQEFSRVVPANGALVFWSFSISLEELFPLFAGSEIPLLQTVVQRLQGLKCYSAGSGVALECHRLIKQVPSNFDLDHRAQLLRVAVLVMTDEFNGVRRSFSGGVRMEDHILSVFEQLTTEEILHLPIQELARRFGCSRRHLNRLFHQYFKLSVAALKMEMRLLKAISLLRDPGTKIISVAESCGFNHLGLFNTCFRKRFGTSPGEWRKRNLEAQGAQAHPLQDSTDCSLRNNGLCPWAPNSSLGSFSAPVPAGLSGNGHNGGTKKTQPGPKPKNNKHDHVTVENGNLDPVSGHLTFQAKCALINPSQNASL
jgi:AraC-like DNA-binding protein